MQIVSFSSVGTRLLGAAMALALVGILVAAPAEPASAATCSSLSTLPLTFPVQDSSVANYFNRVARPTDIAAFPSRSLNLMPSVTAGQRMPIFTSWATAESTLPGLKGTIQLVEYDPEHWTQTPTSEQNNLVATVAAASAYAHSQGLRFMLAPDRRFDNQYITQLAPYADAYMLQGQRLQDYPSEFKQWVTNMTAQAHSVNPTLPIFVQVNANGGTPSVMLTDLQSVCSSLNGVAVWSMPPSLPTLQQFNASLRAS